MSPTPSRSRGGGSVGSANGGGSECDVGVASSAEDPDGDDADSIGRSTRVARSCNAPSPLQRIDADAIPFQPWRNGGGRTRELLCWPSADAWSLRISLADIEADGPFSAFPGVERWFTVVAGGGVELSFPDGATARRQRLRRGDAPFRFDGAEAPGCRLVDGPTRDLNLMARGGTAAMRRVESGAAWREPFALRGLFAALPGTLICAAAAAAVVDPGAGPQRPASTSASRAAAVDAATVRVEAGTLLWDAAATLHRRDTGDRSGAAVALVAPWRFEPDANAASPVGWWLGYTPDTPVDTGMRTSTPA